MQFRHQTVRRPKAGLQRIAQLLARYDDGNAPLRLCGIILSVADNDELLAKARFHAGHIIDGGVEPLAGATLILKECSLECQPPDTSLDPFVYWASECEDASDSDRQIYCRRAIVEVSRVFLNPSHPVPAEYSDPDPELFDVIRDAERLIGLAPAADGEEDPRWQAIIAMHEFIEKSPEPIWQFIRRWGPDGDHDLQAAIATCLLEHLLEHHFDAYFERVEAMSRGYPSFVPVFMCAGKFGQSELPANVARWDALERELRGGDADDDAPED